MQEEPDVQGMSAGLAELRVFFGQGGVFLSWLLIQGLDFSCFYPGGNKSGIGLKPLDRCGKGKG